MRVLVWHVHGAWTTAFVHGDHTYLVPVTADRGPDGRGRARTYPWPDNAVEITPEQFPDEPIDVVVLQRFHELALTEKWLGRRPGTDVPAVFVEHDPPHGQVPHTRHPLAHRADIPVVHVTHFNELFWDCGRAPSTVIEHGIVDPGHQYTGKVDRAAVVINEPLRRGRKAGTDLLQFFAHAAPLDLFGMQVHNVPQRCGIPGDRIATHEDLPQRRMHELLAARRVYVHPYRWTSLGLALLEAMQLGMPVVALAATEAIEAVPPDAGVVSTRLELLTAAVREFLSDVDSARAAGHAARTAALKRYPLDRFLTEWNGMLREVTR